MENLFIVTYDICNDKRWRKVFQVMKGFGEWLQLSVFQCRMTKMRLIQLEDALGKIVNHSEDHVLIVDLGPAENVKPRVKSIGKAFHPIERKSIII
jgi:CRISPR-associated protein Cas2